MEFVIVLTVTFIVVTVVLVRAMRKPPPPMEDALNILTVEDVDIALPMAVAESISVAQGAPRSPVTDVSRQPSPPAEPTKPRRNHLAYGTVSHFPELPTKTVKCVGMGHYLSASQRERLNPGFVLAIPEPKNRHDANAIALSDPSGRKLGYLSAGQAKSYSPLIQALGALQLDCRRDGIQLWIDLPNLPALRKRVTR